MKTKTVYRYDAETKILMGPMECQPSPLEADKGIYIVPAHSTEIKPPKQKRNEVVVFQEDRWVKMANFVGVPFWDKKTREKKSVDKFGDKPSRGWTDKEPGESDTWDETAKGWVFSKDVFNANIDAKIKQLRMAMFQALKDSKQAEEMGMEDVRDDLKAQAENSDREIRALAAQKK